MINYNIYLFIFKFSLVRIIIFFELVQKWTFIYWIQYLVTFAFWIAGDYFYFCLYVSLFLVTHIKKFNNASEKKLNENFQFDLFIIAVLVPCGDSTEDFLFIAVQDATFDSSHFICIFVNLNLNHKLF